MSELYKDIQVTVITKTGETRIYETYTDFQKDFRFFWSSGQESNYEDGAEKQFQRMINALRLVDEHDVSMTAHLSGLTEVFTLKKW